MFSIVIVFWVIFTVPTIKGMVFIPDSDVINIDDGNVKSEQFHDGKGALKLPTTDGMHK